MSKNNSFEVVSRNYFLDTSAIVKLLCTEAGSEKLKALKNYPGSNFCTSWVLLSEAFGVLKRKWMQRELSDAQYEERVRLLFLYISMGYLDPVDVVVADGHPQLVTYEFDISSIRADHPGLDAADALQFKAIQQGLLKYLAGESRPRLVSADVELLKAAEVEGIPVVSVCNDA